MTANFNIFHRSFFGSAPFVRRRLSLLFAALVLLLLVDVLCAAPVWTFCKKGTSGKRGSSGSDDDAFGHFALCVISILFNSTDGHSLE
uniref:Secreted protein n=1 Tax=Globodera rostochiensis TaxID=31243 RepID=A0A914HF63_GLORO